MAEATHTQPHNDQADIEARGHISDNPSFEEQYIASESDIDPVQRKYDSLLAKTHETYDQFLTDLARLVGDADPLFLILREVSLKQFRSLESLSHLPMVSQDLTQKILDLANKAAEPVRQRDMDTERKLEKKPQMIEAIRIATTKQEAIAALNKLVMSGDNYPDLLSPFMRLQMEPLKPDAQGKRQEDQESIEKGLKTLFGTSPTAEADAKRITALLYSDTSEKTTPTLGFRERIRHMMRALTRD